MQVLFANNIETLFKSHYRALCLYATHYLGDIDMAEDTVMDCFVRYTELASKGEKIKSPKSYLYQMVRNRCMDELRNANNTENVESLPELPDDTDYFERFEREASLWSEIDKLPPTCRTVFLMSKRDGLKYETIAESLNISVKTVEAHICKAYTVLRGKAKIIYSSILMLFA